ncbi:MAG TPA: serine/threonine protein phosphatase [Methanocorpusculum sp.]|nr:serine/threonine protein phosphatase [Methanocorpusculum sp.]
MTLTAENIKGLHRYEIKILLALERMMRRYSWVPEDDLRAATHLSKEELKYRCGTLMEKDFVRAESVPYRGYALVFAGYDTIALRSLVDKQHISALGAFIGVGKESEIYKALGFGEVILKFHKIGQRSFQTVRTNREYMPESGHCPWIFASAKSASREYEALKALNGHVSVPVPIALDRHVIVMSFIDGVNLFRCTLANPDETYQKILDEIRAAYRVGYIHGDLSEYNIMVDDENLWIIDWPQWVAPDHPNAEAALRHDMETVCAFFAKKYRKSYSADDAVAYVKS